MNIRLQIDKSKGKDAIEYLENELNKLNKSKPIMEGEILINTTHVVEKDNDVRIGFYIRNGTNQAITLNQIPVKFLSQDGKLVDTKGFKLEKPITIKSYRATPYTILIDKSYHVDGLDITVDSKLGLYE